MIECVIDVYHSLDFRPLHLGVLFLDMTYTVSLRREPVVTQTTHVRFVTAAAVRAQMMLQGSKK